MRLRSFSLYATFLLSFALCLTTRTFSSDFPPVNPAELKITSLPSQPGAAAFILAHEEKDDDQLHFHSVYMRIKVLTEAGREHANVELPYNDRNFDIAGIHGRTIHADGTIIPFEGKPFEKVIAKGKDLRYKVKAFTMPDVQIGSIIEYRFELRYNDNMLYAPKWTLQEEMFQQHLHFIFKPWNREVMLAHGRVGSGFAWTWHTPHNEQPVKNRDTIEISLDNVPPFVEDDYMPPADLLKYYVFFYYQSARSSDEFWKDEGKFWSKEVDHFANKSDALSAALSGVIAPTDTSEQRVRKIYAFVTKLENTTYLPDRSTEEQKALGLKENKTVADVLRQKSGDRDEITRLFIGMVRQAGIPAYAMRVTGRDTSFFLPQLLTFSQLDYDIAIVQLDGKDVYLDPGTRFCPYGMLYWKYSAARGLRQLPDGKGATIAESDLGSYKDAQIQRVLLAKLGFDGEADGTLKVAFVGQEAIRRRLRGLRTDAAGRTKMLEDEVKSWLPSNAEVTLSTQPNWDSDGILAANFKVTIPMLSSAGKRVFMPAHLLAFNERERFPHATREYPVYFDYPYTTIDEIHVELPENLQLESLPAPTKVSLEYAAYIANYAQNNRELVLKRQLAMGGNIFQKERYQELRDFYQKTRASDQQQLLLKAAARASGN
jgi:hypothetical protein